MAVPSQWQKYLAFNKLVPEAVLPADLKGRRLYLTSLVLPMGYLNSVALAQRVHRNLVKFSADGQEAQHSVNCNRHELRKDRPFSCATSNWRVYLDNYMICSKRCAAPTWWTSKVRCLLECWH